MLVTADDAAAIEAKAAQSGDRPAAWLRKLALKAVRR